jgi:hypothetical protein
MKKIIFSLLFLAAIMQEVSAIEILMRGGGRNQKFWQVRVTRNQVSCTGTGSIVCPVGWASASAGPKLPFYSFNEILDYVEKQIDGGNKTGEVLYMEELPITWSVEGENYRVKIDEAEVTGLEEYYE